MISFVAHTSLGDCRQKLLHRQVRCTFGGRPGLKTNEKTGGRARTEKAGTGERITETNPKSSSAQPPPQGKRKSFLGSLGPGVITGASDDDPSGIATYSQAGAQFGFGMLWMVLLQFPLMTAIQEICARIGLVTGDGLAAVMKRKYSKKIVLPIASLLLIANTINIGADIGAMSASVRLILPQVPFILVTLSFTALIICAEIFIPYHKYVKVLKYLTLSLFLYLATAIIVGGQWNTILAATIMPHVEFSSGFAMMFVAILGATISPYLFFWQTSEEAEEQVDKKKVKEVSDAGKPHVSKKEVRRMRSDIAVGMAFSQIIMWSVILTAAGSLHAKGITELASAQDAAKALEPLVKTFPNAGEVSKTLFALGIVGTGLLAIPVLAGACGYAMADAFGWRQGLSKKFRQAKYFYLVIAAATSIGLWIEFSGVDPIQALIYSAVINGVLAVPILFAIMKISNDRSILGDKTNRPVSNMLGWATFVIMSLSAVIMLTTWVMGMNQ